MGTAASAIKSAHHVSAMKELYEAKLAEGVTDEELLAFCKEMIASDLHCFRSGGQRTSFRVAGKAKKTKEGNHHHPEPTEEEMATRLAAFDDDHHECPVKHPLQTKPCDYGYIIECGSDGPIHAPGIGNIDECINMSGSYYPVEGKYHPRKDLFMREPTHMNEDKTHWLQGKLSFEVGAENPGWRISQVLAWTNSFGEIMTRL